MTEKKDVNVEPKKKEAGEGQAEKPQKSPTKIVNQYALGATAAGLIPLPYLDLGAVGGIQLKMLHRLSKHYGVQFSENLGKSIVAALSGTIATDSLRRGLFNNTIKSIPFVGIIGRVSTPIYAGTATYAMGKLFIQHFETGGTFLNFDPQKAKESFLDLFKRSKGAVYKLKTETEKA